MANLIPATPKKILFIASHAAWTVFYQPHRKMCCALLATQENIVRRISWVSGMFGRQACLLPDYFEMIISLAYSAFRLHIYTSYFLFWAKIFFSLLIVWRVCCRRATCNTSGVEFGVDCQVSHQTPPPAWKYFFTNPVVPEVHFTYVFYIRSFGRRKMKSKIHMNPKSGEI